MANYKNITRTTQSVNLIGRSVSVPSGHSICVQEEEISFEFLKKIADNRFSVESIENTEEIVESKLVEEESLPENIPFKQLVVNAEIYPVFVADKKEDNENSDSLTSQEETGHSQYEGYTTPIGSNKAKYASKKRKN